MDISMFLKGLLTGLIVGFPAGPIGMFCIRNTLKRGRLYGLFSGLGASTADTAYSFFIVFGLTVISNFINNHMEWFRITGGGIFCLIGIFLLISKSSASNQDSAEIDKSNLLGAFVSTFLLCFSNPITLFTFPAIFTAMGIVGSINSYSAAVVLVLGVFTGTSSWWFVLTSKNTISKVKIDYTSPTARLIKKGAGIAILLSGLGLALGNLISLAWLVHFCSSFIKIRLPYRLPSQILSHINCENNDFIITAMSHFRKGAAA